MRVIKFCALSILAQSTFPAQAMWQGDVARLYADYRRKEDGKFPVERLRNSSGVCFGLVIKWFQEDVLNPERRLTESVNILEQSHTQYGPPAETDKTLVNEVWSDIYKIQESQFHYIFKKDKAFLIENTLTTNDLASYSSKEIWTYLNPDYKSDSEDSSSESLSIVQTGLSTPLNESILENLSTGSPYKMIGVDGHTFALWRQENGRYIIYDPNDRPIMTQDPVRDILKIFKQNSYLSLLEGKEGKQPLVIKDLIFEKKAGPNTRHSWTFSKNDFSSFIKKKMLPSEMMGLRI